MRPIVAILSLTLVLGLSPAFSAERSVSVNPRNVDTHRKIALVIGNSSYKVPPLKNPANDAAIMAKTLRSLGFTVDERINLGMNEMKQAIESFGQKIRQGGVGLFYYAGHGMQVNGQNYLIPVDANIEGEAEVDYKSVNAGLVLVKMEMAKNAMNIVILDACRNNPFARSFRSSNPGLALMNAPSGTLIAYATAPGSVASDGTGANGLYTQEVVKAIRKPGLKIEDAFKQVRSGVQKQTHGKQVPWEASSLVGDFYFSGSASTADTSRLEGLVEGSKERQAELKRLKRLEDDAARQKEQEQADIAKKEKELAVLDSQIAAMKSKLGTSSAGPDDSLEKMLTMVEKKEADAQKIEQLKKQRETKEAIRMAEIARLKKEAEAKRKAGIEKDIATFEKIANSPYGKDMVHTAWKSLIAKYASVEGIEIINEGNTRDLKDLLTDGIVAVPDPDTKIQFVKVKGGCFQMGDIFGDGLWDEKPVHEVCVDDFYIGKYEITQDQWELVVRSNPSYFKKCGGNCPVEGVSWDNIQAFIHILNKRTGKTYRLPTEAEWEYAARSGGKKEKWAGTSNESELDNYAWSSSNSDRRTHPVGQKKPNALGIYDMSGNVWELCQDGYSGGYYANSLKDNPQGPSNASGRVLRGGSWFNATGHLRAVSRFTLNPEYRGDNYGFRLVRTP